MREIKFRAWYKPQNTMIQPDKLESINFETKTVGVYMPIENRGFHKLRLSDFEVMQYTGLKDKNGKEIYEGDIVHLAYNRFGNKVVEWKDGQYPIREYRLDKATVVGNIYENPELFE